MPTLIHNYCKILRFSFLPRKPVVLPQFMGSALRGVMGIKLEEYSQRPNRSADDVYTELFLRYDKKTRDTPPPPYAFYHAGLKKRLPHEPLVFEVKLFGAAVKFSSDVIQALKDGCAEEGLSKNRHPFDFQSVAEKDTHILVFEPCDPVERATLCFDTRLRTKTTKDGVMWSLDFELLMRNIIRRLQAFEIARFDDAEVNGLRLRALEVRVAQSNLKERPMLRYSNKQEKKLSLGGLLGSITFEGDLTEFMPYLKAGGLLQIGKSCTMGLGHYLVGPTMET